MSKKPTADEVLAGSEQFMRDFMKEIVHKPLERAQTLEKWAEKMRDREKQLVGLFRKELEELSEQARENNQILSMVKGFQDAVTTNDKKEEH